METLVKRFIRTQKENLKQTHNERYEQGDYEFRLIYEGGLAESFAILYRRIGERNFKYFDGFSAYKFNNKEQVIAFAKALTSQKMAERNI